jgi:7-cyano-7-deazaguanine synthase in queuosine biosynthesis
MTSLRVELGPSGISPSDPMAVVYEWPTEAGRSDTIRSDLGWRAAELGTPSPPSRDFLRVVTAAYIADRAARQPDLRLARTLTLTVHVEEPEVWTDDVKERLVDLLHWLTGDDWALRCVRAPEGGGTTTPALDLPIADDVCLLSGGLDSFCGALIRVQQPGTVRFLGHADTSTAVRHAQQRLQQHLAAASPPFPYVQYALRPRGEVCNRVPKTRSLLFMAMAVAAATGTGARRVLVPENGFTSINPPLEPSRGGVLTTRSTHPWTFHSFAELLDALDLGQVEVTNPHAHLTKGELVRQALGAATADIHDLAAETVSCAKINAGRPKGGNPNAQCGLCVACLVRRAAFIAAGVPDRTDYAGTGSAGPAQHVRRVRRHDTDAWRSATTAGIPEHRILDAGLWPPGTDFDAVLDLCARGLKELARVPV